ncbi:MAG: PEP-CTERM sorting domain-containing protein [Acidiferrobacteraceae bacterium]
MRRTFKMKALQAGMVMALAAGTWATAQAATLNVTQLSITGGGFTMGPPSSTNTPDAISGGGLQPLTSGTFQGDFGTAPDYQSSATVAGSLATFTFGPFGPVYTFTAPSACSGQDTGCAASGDTTIYPAPGGAVAPSGTVDTTAGTISMNMQSWFADWNGNNFNQGTNNGNTASSSVATGTYDPTTGAYSISWHSYITGGSFNGQIGYWTLTGNATTAVPEASTAAMMLVGLTLVGGIATRRRKAS